MRDFLLSHQNTGFSISTAARRGPQRPPRLPRHRVSALRLRGSEPGAPGARAFAPAPTGEHQGTPGSTQELPPPGTDTLSSLPSTAADRARSPPPSPVPLQPLLVVPVKEVGLRAHGPHVGVRPDGLQQRPRSPLLHPDDEGLRQPLLPVVRRGAAAAAAAAAARAAGPAQLLVRGARLLRVPLEGSALRRDHLPGGQLRPQPGARRPFPAAVGGPRRSC